MNRLAASPSVSTKPGRPATAIVLGAGVGGLCTAARLVAQGIHVTVFERLRRIGGRFSTREIEGFKLPTGAFMIATDDPLAWTFRDLGIDYPVREANERPVYLIGGEVIEIGDRGGLRTLISAASRLDGSDPDRVMAALRAGLSGEHDPGAQRLPDWLRDNGAGDAIIDVIESNTRAYLGVNAVEVRASAFIDYLRVTSGNARYGIPPAGGLSVMTALADYVTTNGGTIELGAPVGELLTDDNGGRIVGVQLKDGSTCFADVTVSSLALETTAAIAPPHLAARIPEPPSEKNAPGVTSFIASQEPFFEHLSVTTVGTRGVCIITTPTLLAPELAPPGWHFTESLSTFHDSTDQSNPKDEVARHLADLDDVLPRWRERGRLLQTATYRGTWPVARTWIGHDVEDRFPIDGLALVGDSVKGPGWVGVGAVADGARITVEQLLESDREPQAATL